MNCLFLPFADFVCLFVCEIEFSSWFIRVYFLNRLRIFPFVQSFIMNLFPNLVFNFIYDVFGIKGTPALHGLSSGKPPMPFVRAKRPSVPCPPRPACRCSLAVLAADSSFPFVVLTWVGFTLVEGGGQAINFSGL